MSSPVSASSRGTVAMDPMISVQNSVWTWIRSRGNGLFGNLWPWVQSLSRSCLARNVAWSLFGCIFAQGGTFLSSVILARLLGRESFGKLSLIQSTVAAFTTLASLGLGLTATKFITEYRATDPEKIGRLLGLSSMLVVLASACFSVALAVFAPALTVGTKQASIIGAFRVSTIGVFFLTLTGYQLGVLAGFEAFRSIGRIGMICGLALPLLCWCGGLKFGILGAVAAQCAGAFLLWLLYDIAVRSECTRMGVQVQYQRAWEQRSVLLRVSLPATACGTMTALVTWGANAILAKSCGYSELALFAAAGNLRSLVLFLPALTLRVTAPRLNYLFASRDCGFDRAFWGAVGMNGGLALLAAMFAFLCGHPFLHLFGKQFRGSDWLLALVLAAAVIEVVANNLYIGLVARCRFWWNLGIVSIWAILLLAVSTAVSFRLGATGLGIAYFAAWLVAAGLYAATVSERPGSRCMHA